jgi:1-phosphatidylinositol-4-phosphate 5-kinase
MIKTQSKEENRFMKKILPYYYQFLMENPNSLLVRFLGRS